MKYCSSGRKPVERAANGIRILVVGAGPSGLSTGYHLARLGMVSTSISTSIVKFKELKRLTGSDQKCA